MNKLLISLACLIPLTGLHAQNNPKAMSQDVRIKQVVYRDNDVVPVHGVPFTTTQIQFADKEEVLDIEGGDTTAWMVTHHPELGNIVFIKPTSFDSNTNMTVITNKHAYYFHLKSSKTLESTQEQQTYALKFTYPESKPRPAINTNRVAPPLQPKVVNAAYRFSGSPQLVPKHVFDDGQFTYFELTDTGSVPAIFAVDNANGKESTVNTRREGKYIVVHRLAPQFTLRQGRLTTSVFNTQEINRIATNRRPQ
ncbi:TPA: P-type conjugative transfer protein VirB9 [Legionella pneumophila]|nr:P-type conjugative transfer protein VirB9 [Legionella pneumophila]HAT1761291.1 P-type conjugative transfer protein VirB9 [Legionella pneumophila]HAT1763307.1 P-type conjugative transfer protein VirB9 [Legionella pneumophila]HAT1766377.1 P-type conjugative transfer protein VirB9 [Legionella pneumophila]HAT1812217.1 P-type conjugative transfer protein VirB9 [Legionella pneumophila]